MQGFNRNWVEQFYEEINQGLQRFHFFLISSSFLILAIVSSFTDYVDIPDIIVHMIICLGALLSIIFTLVDYSQANISKFVYFTKREEPMYYDVYKSLEWKKIISDNLVTSLWKFISNPLEFSKDNYIAHTWYVPMIFLVFWLIIWYTIYWIPPTIFIPSVLIFIWRGNIRLLTSSLFSKICCIKKGKL